MLLRTVLFIVSGEDARVPFVTGDLLWELRDTVLKQTRNTGRPPEDWEVRLETGRELDPLASVNELVPEGQRSIRLFLSLRCGVGGYKSFIPEYRNV